MTAAPEEALPEQGQPESKGKNQTTVLALASVVILA
jgi:hypothetical protein